MGARGSARPENGVSSLTAGAFVQEFAVQCCRAGFGGGVEVHAVSVWDAGTVGCGDGAA